MTNPFFPPMIRAAHKRAELEGMIVCVTEADRERKIPAPVRQQTESIIVASPRLPARRATNLAIDILASGSTPVHEIREMLPGELIHRETTLHPSSTCNASKNEACPRS